MKTVFTEIIDQTKQIGGVGARYVGTALMVASLDQIPPATLPADDDAISALIDLDLVQWLKIKQMVLTGAWGMMNGRWVNKPLQGHLRMPLLKPKKTSVAPAGEAAGAIRFNPALACFEGVDAKRKIAWQKLHPAADIDILLAECANWLLDNPTDLAKTRNFSKRITNWVKRARVINPAPMLKDPIKESGPHFLSFWAAYHPARQINFTRAASVWKSLDLDREVETVMAGLGRWLESKDWREKDGEFVPSPDKWLLAKRWLDAPAAFKQTAIIRDRSGRVVAHDRSMTERDYGEFGAFSVR
jgi:hypothetical protein